MPKLNLQMNMDNAAFNECGNGPEAARILRELADRIECDQLSTHDDGRLRDINGNSVGAWEVTE